MVKRLLTALGPWRVLLTVFLALGCAGRAVERVRNELSVRDFEARWNRTGDPGTSADVLRFLDER
ncbi:MAG: hypothetical protein JWO31_3564, partial [Phycisphaerales bacterium]|nr:hypothetical protein [Phycisphaerales bacterium]